LEFWKLYPKKVDKPECARKWARMTKADRAAVMADMPRRIKAHAEAKRTGAFLPNWRDPGRYLKGQWRDEPIIGGEDEADGRMSAEEAEALRIGDQRFWEFMKP
jgi:hypothetical protein